MAMISFELEIKNLGKTIKVPPAKSVFEALLENNIKIKTLCGGHGICGKCKIKVLSGNFSEPTASEQKFLTSVEIENGYRLACQVRALSSGIIEMPSESLELHPKIIISGFMEELRHDPNVSKVYVSVHVPKEEKGEAILDLISREITKVYPEFVVKRTKPDELEKLADLFSKNATEFTVTLAHDTYELLDIDLGNTLDNLFGLAIDIGTTTIVVSLIDLNTGETLGNASILNPQIALGDDIISRISYAMNSPDGTKKLQTLVVNGINRLIRTLIKEQNIHLNDIKDVVAVGNSVMSHLFLGVNPSSLGKSPFLPVFRNAYSGYSSDVGLIAGKNAKLYVPPLIAGYIGSDITAGIIASGIHRHKDKIEIFIDIGTNGEIIINKKCRLIATSFAAGGAFEGTKIKFGTRAAEGAIEDVRIDPNTLNVDYDVIGEIKPNGLCGTGILSVVSELVKAGVVDKSGRINMDLKNKRIRMGEKFPEFIIAFADETSIDKDIVINQKDIRELQLAKAAAFAATCLLLRHAKLSPKDVDSFFVAGGFGSRLRVESVKTIGLLPNVPDESIRFLGNTALTGAKAFLLSKSYRSEIADVLRRIEYVNLGGHSEFYKELVDAMHFPHMDLSRFT